MKQIPLTKGFVALVDDEDFSKVIKYKWHVSRSDRLYYAKSWIGGEKLKMHSIVLAPSGKMFVLAPGVEMDHKNGNGLDNRKENLRQCSRAQNAANRGANHGRKFKGVSWNNSRRKWVAQIKKNGIQIYLGRFDSDVEAARIYDKAALELFGEFARLNLPPDDGKPILQ